MTRRKARENAFIALFEISFGAGFEDVLAAATNSGEEYAMDEFAQNLVQDYLQNSDEIDAAIQAKLKISWKLERLPRVNMAVLRLAVAEMRYGKADMEKVVINEAVELAKKYADEAAYQFVNGILGSLARESEIVSEPLLDLEEV